MNKENNSHTECMVEKIVDFLIKVGDHCIKCEQDKMEKNKDDEH